MEYVHSLVLKYIYICNGTLLINQ